MAGTITQADREFVETWENVAVGSYTVLKLDSRGDEKYDLISGRRNFTITSEERILNQERITGEQDPFLNGAFRPVIVPSSVTTESNPNALSDEEIQRIFKSSDIAWSEYMKVIDSPATLRRMLDLAEQADISLKRYKEVERRHALLNPQQRVTTNDRILQNFLPDHKTPDATPGDAVPTAASGTANPRRRGGMSSDYR